MENRELLQRAILEIKDLRRYRRKVAVIGMAVRLPGGATSCEAYWDVFRHGINGIREIPNDRWDVSSHYDPRPGTPGKMYAKYMGAVDGVAEFDAAFFGISPREAEELDPQQRILLETTYHALESAGYAGDSELTDVGVYVGAMSHDYVSRSRSTRSISEYSLVGTAHCMLAGRLAYAFGFKGPATTMDTACSSSLVALHQACLGIKHDDCSVAVVGGVNLILSPDGFIGACQANMLSPEAECRVFAKGSTGYSRGEGCGVMILKDLEKAVEDGDSVLAVIEGTAVNQDGASQGITAPNVHAQVDVMRRCLSNAGLRPDQVTYLETHGTGTPLGDPIEVQAIDAVYGGDVDRATPLLIGAAKANIGHTESAAGIAGLIKAILVLREREAPPILNLVELNEHLRFNAKKIVFPRQREALAPDGSPLHVAVSSFGFSGTNAHVILTGAPAVAGVRRDEPGVVRGLLLSAKHRASMRKLAASYVALLKSESPHDLRALSYSTQVTRGHYAYRRWIPANSVGELESQLAGIADASDDDLAPIAPTHEIGLGFAEFDARECAAFRRAAARHPRIDEIWQRYSASLSGHDDVGLTSVFVNACLYEALIGVGAGIPVVHAPARQALAAGLAAGVLDAASAVEIHRAATNDEALRRVHLSEPTTVMRIGESWVTSARAFVDVLRGRPTDCAAMAVDARVVELRAAFDLDGEDPVSGVLRACYEAGLTIAWRRFYRGSGLHACRLPQYPFERWSYWKRDAHDGAAAYMGRPLLGRTSLDSGDLAVFSDEWSSDAYPFLRDHCIGSDVVFPAAGHLEVALRAALEDPANRGGLTFDLTIHEMLRIPPGETLAVTTTKSNGDIKCHGKPSGALRQTCHMTARVAPATREIAAPRALSFEIADAVRCQVDDFYRGMATGAVQYGPSFRTIRELYRGPDRVLVKVALAGEGAAAEGEYVLHPTLFDGALQAIALLVAENGAHRAYVPVQLTGHFTGITGGRELWCRAMLLPRRDAAPDTLVATMEIAAADGAVIATIDRAVFKALPGDSATSPAIDAAAFEVARRHVPLEIERACGDLVDHDGSRAVDACLRAWTSRSYAEGVAHLDRLCSRIALGALRALGGGVEPGAMTTGSEIMGRGEIQPSYRMLVAKILDHLRAHGALAEAATAVGGPDAEPALHANVSDEELAPALDLLRRCGDNLPSILRGEIDPVTVLFPGGITEGSIYEGTRVSRHLNDLVAGAVRATLAALPEDADVTILEVGAGTGSTTARVLESLRGRRCTYFYTDVSPVFLEFARERFKDHDSIVFKLLDVEKEAGSQGIPADRFDVVIAANVLHVVSDVDRTARDLASVLKPGGFLVLRELVRPLRWLDFTFGLTREWWSFSDFRLTAGSPIVSLDGWHSVLNRCGFTDVRSLFGGGDVAAPEDVIVAQRRRDTATARTPARIVCFDVSGVTPAVRAAMRESFADRAVFIDPPTDPHDVAGFKTALASVGVESIGNVVLFDAARARGAELAELVTAPSSSASVLCLVKAFAELTARLPAVTVVTPSFHPDVAREHDELPLAAQITGVMKVLKQEFPRTPCKVIAVDDVDRALPRVVREIAIATDDAEVTYVGTRRLLPYLRPAKLRPAGAPSAFGGMHLVAGGAGGIGREVVEHLLENGADGVVVLGRRGADNDEVASILADWRRRWGDRVRYFACDISDESSLAEALSRTHTPVFRTVTFSIAGLLDKRMVDMSWDDYQAVCLPKCLGLVNLHRATLAMGLDNFYVFSSAVTLFGTQGQANHAAANAFLDAFTEYRMARGLPVVTINWGLWSEAGAVKDRRQLHRIVSENGAGVIDSALGKRLVALAYRERDRRLVLTPIDAGKLMARVTGYEPFLDELHKRGSVAPTPPASSVLDELRSYGPKKRVRALKSIVTELIREALKYEDASALAEDDNLFQRGVDSLVATDIVSRINRHLATQLSATTIFTHATIAKLVDYIISEAFAGDAAADAPSAADVGSTDARHLGLSDVIQRLEHKVHG
jgi:acyl transferase domain-containing protein/acyl carrier protein